MSLVSRFAPLLCIAAFAPACILATSPVDDDDSPVGTTGFGDTSAGAGPSGPNPGTTGNTPGTDGGDPSGGGDTGDGPTGECTANLLVDGGFETGTPNEAWSANSEVFGTPICDVSCSDDASAVPYAGDWWVWMGGSEMAETASVSQSLVIEPSTAFLTFRFQINDSAGAGTDTFTAAIDGETVFMATDAEEADYANYRRVEIDVSDFADGEPHQVVFSADISGSGTDAALTNFFLDEVELVSCVPEGGEGSTSGTGAEGSTGGDSSTGGDPSGSTGGSGTDAGSSGGSDSTG